MKNQKYAFRYNCFGLSTFISFAIFNLFCYAKIKYFQKTKEWQQRQKNVG